MKYFNNINSLEQAKLHYRKLAKQLHPDKGGSTVEFQQLQKEYKTVLLQLQNRKDVAYNVSTKDELINELGKLAKVLIKKQVPQMYLKHKINKSKSPVEKGLFSEIVNLLDRLG
jgi:hypothetical protein